MKKKLIATVMAATMAVTALTGCGGSSSSSAKKDIKVPTEPLYLSQDYISDGKKWNFKYSHFPVPVDMGGLSVALSCNQYQGKAAIGSWS